MEKNRVGEKYITNQGYEIEIVEYFNHDDCAVKFNSGLIIYNRQYGDVKRGEVRNPYHPSVCGIGYLGVGRHSSILDGNRPKSYQKWCSMLERCYSKRVQNNQPTYIGCLVDERWHNFQNFAEWFEGNYKEGWSLDKDILIKGNKTYSPETCCFVPQEINSLFISCKKSRGHLPIGVKKVHNKFIACLSKNKIKFHLGYFHTPEQAFEAYKTAKERHIKEMADEHKEIITEECYRAMYNWTVEITD